MSAIAVIMMAIAIVVVWGGLVASVLFLRSRPSVDDGPIGTNDSASSADTVDPGSTRGGS